LFAMPAITGVYFGVPTIAGKQVFGPSSPENPALHIPDPLSITIGIPL
jgi:hypothetical protein